MSHDIQNFFDHVRQTLSDESKWLQTENHAAYPNGTACLSSDQHAVKWSLIGAFHRARVERNDPRAFSIVYDTFSVVVLDKFHLRFNRPNQMLTEFNAHPLTTWDDINLVFDMVAEKLELSEFVMTFTHDTDPLP